jgi:hypothetical protein
MSIQFWLVFSIRAPTKPKSRLAFVRPRERCAWYQERRQMNSHRIVDNQCPLMGGGGANAIQT